MGRNIFRLLVAPMRRGAAALVMLFGGNGWAATATSVPVAHPPTAHLQDPSGQRPAGAQTGDTDSGPRNVVARARMLECGHQWSNMKRAGTASGTWKDFSRNCLAQR